MNYQAKRLFFLCVLYLIFAVINIEIKTDFLNTIYSVLSIIFSIGLGLIISFDLNGIKSDKYLISIRSNLSKIRNNFIVYFSISTVFFLLTTFEINDFVIYSYLKDSGEKLFDIEFSKSIIAFTFIIFSISYFIINFLSIQKLKEQIFDQIRYEEKNK